MHQVKLFIPNIRQLAQTALTNQSAAFSACPRVMALHKLKIDSLKLKDGELKEVEVEGIENGKVLLAAFEGKTQALSSWSKTPLRSFLSLPL
jgi:hypothetical protein